MREQSSNRYSTKSIAVRTWSIRQMVNQQLVQQRSSSTRLQDLRTWRNWKRCGDIKWRSTMYTIPQCRWNSQAATLSGNQRYTCTHTKTMYDVCDHSSLPTLAILALGLLKKMMNNFAWAVITLFGYLALCKLVLAVLKVATNTDTNVENAYTVRSAWKCETAKKNWRFRWDSLWDAILHD